MTFDRGERIDRLARRAEDLELATAQEWRAGEPTTWRDRRLRIGPLADGRWFVDLVQQVGGDTRAYATEAQARQVAGQLMAGDNWTEH